MRKVLSILLLILAVMACNKTIDNNPPNPFVGDGGGGEVTIPLDSVTIEGLHQNIFVSKCANPTCHDGSFEPDFRTVQSTYSSLVYHPVVKNDDQESFDFRVVPGDTAASWLVKRLVADEVLGRMPLYAEPLTTNEIEAVKVWVMEGAKDIFGNPAQFPNLPPAVSGFVAFDQNQVRIDTARIDGGNSPFRVVPGTSVTLAIFVEDDSTTTQNLQNQYVEFSYDQQNFFNPKTMSFFASEIVSGSFNASDFLSDTTVYFRYYVEDADGASTLVPNAESPFYFNNYFSFRIQ